MVKKLLKQFTITLSCLGLISVSPINIWANEYPGQIRSEIIETTEDYGISLYGSNSVTIVLPYNSAQKIEIVNMGFNPTVTVTATGNPNMIYKVWVVNPVGITGTIGYVRADGSSIQKNLWASVGGDYYVYVQPWEGTTNGKDVTFNLNITW